MPYSVKGMQSQNINNNFNTYGNPNNNSMLNGSMQYTTQQLNMHNKPSSKPFQTALMLEQNRERQMQQMYASTQNCVTLSSFAQQ